MSINVGDVCILDPTNKYYKQKDNGIIYVLVVDKKGFFKKRYQCLMCDYYGAIISKDPIWVNWYALVKPAPLIPTVVMRYPKDLPMFSEVDELILHQVIGFYNAFTMANKDQIVSCLKAVCSKIEFYRQVGYRENKDGEETI